MRYYAPGNTPKTEHQPHTTMAKYTVTHACGHDHTYQLYGPNRERERKMAWLAEQDCPECRKAAEDEAAAKATEGMDLPELTGTPKQVAWANTIRGKFIAQLKAMDFNTFHSNEIGYKRINKMVREGGFKLAMEMVIAETEARFWIDSRFDFIEGMLTWYAKKLIAAEDAKQAEKPAQEPQEAPKAPETDKPTTPAPKAPQKPVWRKIALNKQNIESNIGRAALINLPHASEHDGYSVWVSTKLLRGADLRGAYLRGAKMYKRDADNASLTQKQRDEIIIVEED